MTKFSSLLFLAFLGGAFEASAQMEFELLTDPNFENVDLSSGPVDLGIHINVKNTGTDTIELKWEFSSEGGQCDLWEIFACDNNNCYSSSITTNLDPAINMDRPSIVAPGEEYDFIMHVLTDITGCCNLVLDFYDIAEIKDVIESIEMPVRINNPTCISSNHNVDYSNISLYPNPTNGAIGLRNAEEVTFIKVTNTIGQKVAEFNHSNSEVYNLEFLSNGIYQVSLFDENDQVLKNIKLYKM